MTDTIEQLWYTRLPGSATRPPGFQVVAASPGLADPRARLTAAAIRLCRYDAPPRLAQPHAPVSYGWVDAGGVRFCFRRCPAGTDELGRPGNMTAHLLAGPPGLLPAAAVMARFGSRWWWDGKVPPGRELQPLDSLAAVPEGRPPAEPDQCADRLAALLDALLTRRPRTLLTLRADPPHVVALVLAAERAVPGLMDAHGVSTYESPRTGAWFDLAGAAEPVPGAVLVPSRPQVRTPPEVSAARVILLSGDRPRVRQTAAQAAGIGTSRPTVTALPRLLAAYSELDAGAVPSSDFLASCLASPGIARLTLAEFPDVPRHVARDLIRERGRVFDALARLAGDGFDPDALVVIGTAAGQELAGPDGSARLLEPVLTRLTTLDAGMSAACCREVLRRADTEPGIVAGAATSVRLALLRQAAADGLAEEQPAVRQLLSGRLPSGWQPVTADRQLPARWRAITLADALDGPAPPDSGELARQLAADPAVAGPLAGLLAGTGPLRAAVRAVPVESRAQFLLTIAASLPDGARDELLCWHARGLARPGTRLSFMALAAQQGLPPRPTVEWVDLATATIAEHLRAKLSAGLVPWPEPSLKTLLTPAGDPRSKAWLAVLALAGQADAHVTPLKGALAQAARLPPPQDAAAMHCAVTFFAARGPSADQFARALAALDGWAEDGADVLVDACLRVLRSERSRGPGTQLGYCLLSLVAHGAVPPGSGAARPSVPSFRRLVRGLPSAARDDLSYHADKLGDPARAWWKRETGMRVRVGEAVGQTAAGARQLLRGTRRQPEVTSPPARPAERSLRRKDDLDSSAADGVEETADRCRVAQYMDLGAGQVRGDGYPQVRQVPPPVGPDPVPVPDLLAPPPQGAPRAPQQAEVKQDDGVRRRQPRRQPGVVGAEVPVEDPGIPRDQVPLPGGPCLRRRRPRPPEQRIKVGRGNARQRTEFTR